MLIAGLHRPSWGQDIGTIPWQDSPIDCLPKDSPHNMTVVNRKLISLLKHLFPKISLPAHPTCNGRYLRE